MHRDRSASEAESPRALASPGVQVDALGPEAKKGADPTGDVINRELADAVDGSDPGVDCLMQVVKGPAVWEALLGQRVGGASKNDSRDTALMRMPLSTGQFGQRRPPDCAGQAGVTGPVTMFAFGCWPMGTAIGADDFGQGSRRS